MFPVVVYVLVVVVRWLNGEVVGGGDTFKGVMEQVVVGVPASP